MTFMKLGEVKRKLLQFSSIIFFTVVITLLALLLLFLKNNNKNREIELSHNVLNSTSTNNLSDKIRNNFNDDVSNLTYNQVLNSKIEPARSPELYDSRSDGRVIEWNAKISSYYSQITGIKFCIIDNNHQNVDIDKPCDWFWAFSGDVANADNTDLNPGWDGSWVKYILNYYKVPFNKDKRFYNDVYTVKGVVNGFDCGVDDKCIPNIDIISINK